MTVISSFMSTVGAFAVLTAFVLVPVMILSLISKGWRACSGPLFQLDRRIGPYQLGRSRRIRSSPSDSLVAVADAALLPRIGATSRRVPGQSRRRRRLRSRPYGL